VPAHCCLRKRWDSASQASDLFIEPSPYTFRRPPRNPSHFLWLPITTPFSARPALLSGASSLRTWRRIVQCIDFLHVTGNWRVPIVVAAAVSSCCCCCRAWIAVAAGVVAVAVAGMCLGHRSSNCCCCCSCCSCLTLRRHMYKLIIMSGLKTESIVQVFSGAFPSVLDRLLTPPAAGTQIAGVNLRCQTQRMLLLLLLPSNWMSIDLMVSNRWIKGLLRIVGPTKYGKISRKVFKYTQGYHHEDYVI